jgi:hypothetical protein
LTELSDKICTDMSGSSIRRTALESTPPEGNKKKFGLAGVMQSKSSSTQQSVNRIVAGTTLSTRKDPTGVIHSDGRSSLRVTNRKPQTPRQVPLEVIATPVEKRRGGSGSYSGNDGDIDEANPLDTSGDVFTFGAGSGAKPTASKKPVIKRSHVVSGGATPKTDAFNRRLHGRAPSASMDSDVHVKQDMAKLYSNSERINSRIGPGTGGGSGSTYAHTLLQPGSGGNMPPPKPKGCATPAKHEVISLIDDISGSDDDSPLPVSRTGSGRRSLSPSDAMSPEGEGASVAVTSFMGTSSIGNALYDSAYGRNSTSNSSSSGSSSYGVYGSRRSTPVSAGRPGAVRVMDLMCQGLVYRTQEVSLAAGSPPVVLQISMAVNEATAELEVCFYNFPPRSTAESAAQVQAKKAFLSGGGSPLDLVVRLPFNLITSIR